MPSAKVVIVVPAYNVAKTLEKTIKLIPQEFQNIIVVDDGSSDQTASIAKKLNLKVISHRQNRGYGATQKTGYRYALKENAAAAVLLHGDGQYDPRLVPQMVKPILKDGVDVVSGSRILGKRALSGGMPFWKYFFNRGLTFLENLVLGTKLSEFHSGFRAYSQKFLKKVPFELNSDKFDFDTDILIQAQLGGFKISEIPIPTIYDKDSSMMTFKQGIRYGLGIIKTLIRYKLHTLGLIKEEKFNGLI